STSEAQWRWFCKPRPECPRTEYEQVCPSPLQAPVEPPIKEAPKEAPKELKDTLKEPAAEPALPPLTTVALADTTTSVPEIMGDFFGYCAQRFVTVPVKRVVTSTVTIPNSFGQPTIITTQTLVPDSQRVLVCDPIASRAGSGFKVADNESPRP